MKVNRMINGEIRNQIFRIFRKGSVEVLQDWQNRWKLMLEEDRQIEAYFAEMQVRSLLGHPN